MKKINIAIIVSVLLLLILNVPASSQTFYNADRMAVSWDAASPMAGSTIEYRVYVRLTTQDKSEGVLKTTVSTLSATLQFTEEGRYYAGVQAVRKVGGIEVSASTISWSDDSAVVQGGLTFGAGYYEAPVQVKNLKKL